MPLSNTIAASAPRSSAAIQSTIECPPISSSPSQANRTLTGSSPGRREQLGGLQEHEELALVICDPARVEPAVALDELEGRRFPEVERVGGLHVEMPVAEDRGSVLGILRGTDLADDERPRSPRHDVGAAPGPADALGHPLRRRRDIGLVRSVGADRGDRDQLRELGDEGLVGRQVHAGESSRAGRVQPRRTAQPVTQPVNSLTPPTSR